jgi:hypothetical protein
VACILVYGPALAQVSKNVSVPAATEWTDTGIDLLPGDFLTVRASGRWSNVTGGQFVGQNGYGTPFTGTVLADAPLAALITRIGGSVTRPSLEPATVLSRGRLFLGMNDVPGTYGDNQGALEALIRYRLVPAPMQDFTGTPVGEAKKWLSRYQFEPLTQESPSNSAKGAIFKQEPAPSVDLHGVANVTLTVSAGPTPALRGSNGRSEGTRSTENDALLRPLAEIAAALAAVAAIATAIVRANRRRRIAKLRTQWHFKIDLDRTDDSRRPASPLPQGPTIRLRIDFESGATVFPGPVPVLKREVIHER